MRRVNRAEAIEVTAEILKFFEGIWVDVTVREQGQIIDAIRGVNNMLVPVLKARKTDRKVEFVLSYPYKDSEGKIRTPVRMFSVEAVRYDEEDALWEIRGQGGSLILGLEPNQALIGPNSHTHTQLQTDPDIVALGTVEAIKDQMEDATPIVPAEEIGNLTKWRVTPAPRSTRYYVQTIHQAKDMTEWAIKGAAVVEPDGDLFVVPLDGDVPWAQQQQVGLRGLIDSSGGPDEVLDYLYERDSTVTAYAKPVTLLAVDINEAAGKAARREAGA